MKSLQETGKKAGHELASAVGMVARGATHAAASDFSDAPLR